jgi:general secretion pathway protein F
MPTYQYEASDAAGKIERGLLDSDSERHARQLLRAQGLLPLALNETAGGRGRARNWTSARLRDAELGWLTRQLAGLLAAGLTLEQALTVCLEQAERRHVSHVLAAVRGDIRAGHRLCDALAARPRDFPSIYCALVEAGEQSGELPEVMERLATYIESRGDLRSKILTAFIYPAIVTLVAVAVVIFLLSYVVPQVVTAFSHTQQTLPLLTRMMLAGSDFVRSWGLETAAMLVLLWVLWRWTLRVPSARLAWHARLLRLPVVGRYILGVNTARYASTLAILTASGVPLLNGLEAARRTLTNDHLRLAAEEAALRVREGSSLAQALQSQKAFPPLLVHMIGSGERTGELPTMLERAAATLSTELERRAMALTAALEPLMTLVMGGMVLVIVLAVMMPIIEINQLIR